MKRDYILSFLLTMFFGALTINAQSETVMVSPNGPIPDNNPAGVNFTLTVTNNFVMTDVDVHIEANHTWIGDLIFEITSPSGTTVRIVDRPGVPNTAAGCSSNGPDITLDDDAADPIEDECLTTGDTITGTFSPNNPLSAFIGENSAGIWTLFVSDNAGLDLGNLLNWGITYNYGVCVPGDLTAVPFLSGNNFAGNMFNVTASGGGDISIEKFDINIGPGPANISVFSRPGSYVGFENNSAGWTLMGSEIVNGLGAGTPTELNVGGLTIPDGDTYGIYITVTDHPSVSMFYTNGDNVFSDSYLTIATGVGKGAPDFTGSTFASRSWNGTVYYCVSGSPPPNDLIQNAISVTSESQPYTDPDVSLQFATYEPFNPTGCILTGVNGVWYSFTAGSSGTAEASITTPSGFSAVIFYEAPSESVADESELNFVVAPGNQCALGTSANIPTIAGQSYYIFVLNTNGPSDVLIDISNSLSVNENTIDGFVMYPNPTTNVLNLNSNISIDDITVYNLIGQKVLSQTIDATSSQINVNGLSTGTYLIKVNVEGQTATYQFIKK